MQTVRVNRKAESRVASGHPWIFRSDIIETSEAQPGDSVHVVGQNGRSLGTAHYSSTSQIALRLLSPNIIETSAEFFQDRIHTAERYRIGFVSQSNAYRLVYAEADGLPGLIVDRYANHFTIQTLDQGMDRATPHIVSALVDLFSAESIVARNEGSVRVHEDLPREVKVLHGETPQAVPVEMNGIRFHVDLAGGQKTGIFLDQRENYVAAARYARGRALDCFTSTGGFALHLARNANSVDAIDSSGPALETARKNAGSNHLTNIRFREGDVFEFLASGRGRYDTIVLDPPAFAKSRSQVDSAIRAYKEINLRALKMLEPEGVLVTCSCSHHVSEADLLGAVAQAALDAKKAVRILERRMQAQDHPVLLTVPETLYLKCLVLVVA